MPDIPSEDLDEEQGDQSPEVPADLLELHVAIEVFGEGEPE